MADTCLDATHPSLADAQPDDAVKYVKIYSVEEASRITGVPEIEIIDSVRTGWVRTYFSSDAEPSFPVPYVGKVVRHRSLIRIAEDELEQIHVDLDHRWQHLDYLADEPDQETAIHHLKQALLAWYGAALDDPENREAAGVVRCLKVFACRFGLREDGSVEESPPASLKAVA